MIQPFLQTLGVQKDTHQTSGTVNTNNIFDKHLDLREMGCKDGRWMELAQDRVNAGFHTNGVETLCSGKNRVRRI